MATPTTLPASFTTGQVLTAAQMNNLRGAFRVMQVVQTVKTDVFTSNSTTWIDITGLSVSITPSSTTSKILVMFTAYHNFVNTTASSLRLVRGSTAIYVGDAAGSRPQASTFIRDTANVNTASGIYLDSPNTTSATTYKLQMLSYSTGTQLGSINRGSLDSDTASYDARTASSITVMEISA